MEVKLCVQKMHAAEMLCQQGTNVSEEAPIDHPACETRCRREMSRGCWTCDSLANSSHPGDRL